MTAKALLDIIKQPKSQGARSVKYCGWPIIVNLWAPRKATTSRCVWGLALPWWNFRPLHLDSGICPFMSLVKKINAQRPESGCKGLKFHHDNARPHTHRDVVAFLEVHEFIIMDHPPYSPDPAPCALWPFDYIKQHLSDHTSVKVLMPKSPN